MSAEEDHLGLHSSGLADMPIYVLRPRNMPDSHRTDTDRYQRCAERFVVIGTSGAGKTTVAKEIARILDVPHVEFDSYRHGPNWTETPDDVFREQLSEALQGEAWVADGNYSVARDVVWPRAATLVWLDYQIHIVLWRLFWRIMRRGILREELWNGNKENIWWHFFTRESLFLWAWRSHWRRRRTLPSVLAQPEHAHLQVVHLHSPKVTREWVSALAHDRDTF